MHQYAFQWGDSTRQPRGTNHEPRVLCCFVWQYSYSNSSRGNSWVQCLCYVCIATNAVGLKDRIICPIWNKHFSWDLGWCFGSLVLPHAHKPRKNYVHDFLSEIRISESTPPTVSKRASQFRRPLLRRKGAHFNITSHFPTPSNPRFCGPADKQLRRGEFGCRTRTHILWILVGKTA